MAYRLPIFPDNYDAFEQEINAAQKRLNVKYADTRIHIFSFVDDDNKMKAGVNWGAWGTQPPYDARVFGEALIAAADMCDQINATYDYLDDI